MHYFICHWFVDNLDRYANSIAQLDELASSDTGKVSKFFFNRVRIDVPQEDIKLALRKQASAFLHAPFDIAAYYMVFMRCGGHEARLISIIRQVIYDLEIQKEQTLDWWGVIEQRQEERHAHVVILGRDSRKDMVLLRDLDCRRIGQIATEQMQYLHNSRMEG